MFKRLAQLFRRHTEPRARQAVRVYKKEKFGISEIEENLQAGSTFLAEQPRSRDPERGKALALHLQWVAFALAMQRGTDGSTAMWQMSLMAAKVALLSHGPNATSLQRFERDLGEGWAAEDYEQFKFAQSCIPSHD